MKIDSLQEILDREGVRDCLMRYSRGIDRCDREMLATVYWPDAVDERPGFRRSVREFIDFTMPFLAKMDQTMHTLGNIFLRIEGKIARVETYFQAYHRIRKGNGEPYDLIIAGRYLDRMEKRDGEWRIAARLRLLDWYREYPDSGTWGEGAPLNTAHAYVTRHHPDDPSHAFFEGRETTAKFPAG